MTTINMLVEYPTSARVEVELPDGKVWADVQDYHIKYGVLVMWFHDDTMMSRDLDLDPEPNDCKWPSRTIVTDEQEWQLDARDDNIIPVVPKNYTIATHDTLSGLAGCRIFHSIEDAWKWRDEIARENWDEFFNDLTIGGYPNDDGDRYWEEAAAHGEFFSTGDAVIEPKGETK